MPDIGLDGPTVATYCGIRRLPRQLLVHFYTSNLSKYLQARLVFSRYGINLRYFESHTTPYEEDYGQPKERLLASAVAEVTRRVGERSIFFVEDTSLRIEALSELKGGDYPGLAVKEWFPSVTFDEVDRELRRRGNDRRAVVKSDIAAHIPGLARPVYFHGETRGVIAETPPNFEASPLYPWLNPTSFNGWLIPDRASKRLGEMSFEESWSHDFRIAALLRLVGRLEEYSFVLNSPSHAVTVPQAASFPQGSLFPATEKSLVILGRTCAGKTTFGRRMLLDYDVLHIEGSNIVRAEIDAEGATDQQLFELSVQLHRTKGLDFVAKSIIDLHGDSLRSGFVITGLRHVEELVYLRKHFPELRVVWIAAGERTRAARYLTRGRDGSAPDINRFKELDRQHEFFSLLRFGSELADIRIENEGTLPEYLAQIDFVTGGRNPRPRGISFKKHQTTPSNRAVLKLLALLQEHARSEEDLRCASGLADEFPIVLASAKELIARNGDVLSLTPTGSLIAENLRS